LVSDAEIKFQMPEKRGRTFNRGELGMQKSHKVWKAFLEILQGPDHTYSLGKAAFIGSGKEKTRVKDYDTRRQAMLLINGKLIMRSTSGLAGGFSSMSRTSINSSR